MISLAFHFNFSNQGVGLLTFKIKERKLRRAKKKESKMHALYINPFFLGGSGVLHPLKNRLKSSYIYEYVVFNGSRD